MGKLARVALGLSLLSLLLALVAVDASGNPCAVKNPCAANPCTVKNPCAANPCAAKASVPAVAVGERAPNFTLASTTGQKISLSQFQGKKSVLLFFYSQDFNPT